MAVNQSVKGSSPFGGALIESTIFSFFSSFHREISDSDASGKE